MIQTRPGILSKIVGEYDKVKNHNHKLQTNPWHREEEPHNNRETPRRQTKNGQQPPGGLNAFYLYQIFTLDSAVVEIQNMFSSHGGLITIAMYHHGETL